MFALLPLLISYSLVAQSNNADYVHHETGLKFPSQLVGFARFSTQELPKKEYGTVVQYNDLAHKGLVGVTIYVYPVPPGAQTEGELPPCVVQEFRQTKNGVMMIVKAGRYENVRWLSETKGVVSTAAMKWSYLKARCELGTKSGTNLSLIYLALYNPQYFLKIRATMVKQLGPEMETKVDRFLEELLRYSSEIRLEEPVSESNNPNILSLIDEFVRDPLRYSRHVPLILKFGIESNDVVIVLDGNTLPWATKEYKYKELLLAAYCGGNIRSQLTKKVVADAPEAGRQVLFSVYKKLQTQDPGYVVPEIEEVMKSCQPK